MDAEPLRAVFFGTSEFAVPILQKLSEDRRFRIVLVVTQPDRPSGRGMKLQPPALKVAAETLDLHVVQPNRIRSTGFRNTLASQRPDFLMVAAYGRILPAGILSIPKIAPLNVHASLLPQYRGAAPIQRALMDGVPETGVTVMWMNEAMDEGDIVLQEAVPVMLSDDAGLLSERLAAKGAELLVQAALGLASGTARRVPQDHAQASYAPPITPEDTVLRFDESAFRCHNRVRALSPRPGAVTAFRGKRLKVFETWPLPCAALSALPGSVIECSSSRVVCSTAEGALELRRVQLEGARPMAAAEWARGARIQIGEILGQHGGTAR